MRAFHIDCELTYLVQQQTLFLFNLGIPSNSVQRVRRESLRVSPRPTSQDEFANFECGNRFARVDVAPGEFNIRYLATVEVEEPDVEPAAEETSLAILPASVLPFLLPSKYCEADQLFHFAVEKFGNGSRGYQRVEAICEWIRSNIAYRIGTSSPFTTASHVLSNGAGVCRDFAHLAITFCRALNIPARFVTGYARYSDPPPDFHAIFEAYLGNKWYLFDPTLLAPLSDVVRIGTGRDASEVAFATFFGNAQLRRISPLIELVGSTAWPVGGSLAELQTPTSGMTLLAA